MQDLRMPDHSSCLIFLATYNEAENIQSIFEQIRSQMPEADILFIDDNSPDGSGRIIDEIVDASERVHVIHRPSKQGIGSAHRDALNWAYDNKYDFVITMDCDLAHSPEYLPVFFGIDPKYGVVIGTRFHDDDSLPGWNLHRRFLTHLGHLLTRFMLQMPYDATGALRRYNLNIVPRRFLDLFDAPSYSFFFESLHILFLNKFLIKEIPIELPARIYGSSKMRLADVFGGFSTLLRLALKFRFQKSKLLLSNTSENSPVSWDKYWAGKDGENVSVLYDKIAVFYRNYIIRPALNRCINRFIPPGSSLLHAGCGSGAVDGDLIKKYNITACDFSNTALETYRKIHGDSAVVVNADLAATEFPDAQYDGIYNLGVMEHFTEQEIDTVLKEFHRILKPNGRIILFWPPEYGLSVIFLKIIHYVLNDLLGRNIHLHPAEPSRVKSREWVTALIAKHGFSFDAFIFGPRDAFTYSVIVAHRTET
jgi:dolichol-phosphate mannosyltransferase